MRCPGVAGGGGRGAAGVDLSAHNSHWLESSARIRRCTTNYDVILGGGQQHMSLVAPLTPLAHVPCHGYLCIYFLTLSALYSALVFMAASCVNGIKCKCFIILRS